MEGRTEDGFLAIAKNGEEVLISEVEAIDISNVSDEELKDVCTDFVAWSDDIDIIAETYKSDAFPLITEQNIIYSILKHDEHFNHSVDDIAEFFKFHSNLSERIDFIKSVFDDSYCEILIEDSSSCERNRYGYKAHDSGLFIWKGSYLNRTMHNDLSWETIESHYADMIRKDILTDSYTEQLSFFDYNDYLDLTGGQDKSL